MNLVKSASRLGSERKSHVALLAGILILITAAVGLTYQEVLEHGFLLAWDDNVYVSENPRIRALGPSDLSWMATAFHASNWHPLTWFSHALDYALVVF